MASLAGTRVLITGAARGIGAALARECTRRGARIALVGLEPHRLKALAHELGPGHMWAEADVTSSTQLAAAVDAAVSAFGGLDHVVANAGIASYGTIRQTDPDAFARVVDINLTGMFRTLHASIPTLIETGGYALVVSSAAAFAAVPGLAAYCASKAGAEALAGSARGELAHLGVAVGSAHPLWIDTDLVRDAEVALPSFRANRDRLPWPLRATTDLPTCVRALADGLERRAPRVYVPRSAALLHATRAVATSRLASRVMFKIAATSVPKLEREVAAYGRNLGTRPVTNAGAS